ncbi:MAG: MarR family transcriptional regulator [Alphaproteobacteria bacterium]|nr:MarR family transcriptional regulator [Alphaproteobacteria bacterium]
MDDQAGSSNPLQSQEDSIRQAIELLFYAYRDFTADPDEILRRSGFGRAHHRCLHFIGRNPGIAVSELLTILKITKQSLSRVLSQLIAEGFVRQEVGARDKRRRLLYLTEKGRDLHRQLIAPQRRRVGRAFREAGPEAVSGYCRVLALLIDERERAQVLVSIAKP